MALFVKIFERDRREVEGRGCVDREMSHGGKGRRGLARERALYFSCVVIKVYYANEIMSAALFYRG